jgi:hypothetical protein
VKGSTSQRVTRLLLSLLRQPHLVWPYCKFLPAWGRQPAAIELPWFSFGAIAFLDKYLCPQHRVFEFGSGGSSLFFARRAASVLSVESHAEWQQRVAAMATDRRLSNLRCELHPVDTSKPDAYPGLSYFTALQPVPYDVIAVDGYCDYDNAEFGLLRDVAFDRALTCVRRPGGIIVVDDFWMFPEMSARAQAAHLTVFESPGPCRYGVTSTAVFQF